MDAITSFSCVKPSDSSGFTHGYRGVYTGYAGWAVTTRIPVKFGTAHGRSRSEVGSMKYTDVYGSRGVSRPSLENMYYQNEGDRNNDMDDQISILVVLLTTNFRVQFCYPVLSIN